MSAFRNVVMIVTNQRASASMEKLPSRKHCGSWPYNYDYGQTIMNNFGALAVGIACTAKLAAVPGKNVGRTWKQLACQASLMVEIK